MEQKFAVGADSSLLHTTDMLLRRNVQRFFECPSGLFGVVYARCSLGLVSELPCFQIEPLLSGMSSISLTLELPARR